VPSLVFTTRILTQTARVLILAGIPAS
jgi:hypothetical protein